MMLLAALLAALSPATLSPAVQPSAAQPPAAENGAAPCAAVERLSLPDVRIEKVTPIAAQGGFSSPDSRAPKVDVAFCRIEGVIEKEIGFELWLPLDAAWNGRLLTGGVGGQAGNFNYRELARGVSRGYASASTDTGHKASERHWLLGDPMRAVNYAERANHLLAVKARALIGQYYARPVARSIFVGCSGGGRQAMTQAQRYPDDYDGIIAGAPGVNTPVMSARRMWEMIQHRQHAGLMSAADWALVARKGVAACDMDDGVRDGLVNNPAACRFDMKSLLCKPGQEKECLNARQLAFAERIYAPLHDENGKRLDDGIPPGVPVSATPLPEPFTPGPPYLAVALFGDGVHRDRNWDASTFRLADDLPAIDRVMNLHADNPDLNAFRDRGGKLILYQGWADPLVLAQPTIAYFEAVQRHMGGEAGDISDFLRLYMVPGMDHCVGGAGPDLFGATGGEGLDRSPRNDMLSALERWLDVGEAPDEIIAVKRDNDAVTASRPLCPFPQAAHYSGKGDPKRAESYHCR